MRNTIIEKINKSALKFLEPLSPKQTYETILNEALKLIKAEHGSIILSQENELVRVYTTSNLLGQMKIRKNGYSYRAFKNKKPYIVDVDQLNIVHPEVPQMGGRSVIYIPLSYRNESIGVLVVQSRNPINFAKKELEILKLFGSMASLAIRKSQLYDETRRALDLRDQFISMAAHELRTPLTSINGYAQMLYLQAMKSDSPDSKWIKSLYPETVRLTNLVRDLLDINKIKTGQFDYFLKECSFIEVVKRGIDSVEFSYPNHKIIFTNKLTQGDDRVIADFDKLVQVVVNLLDNAAKFSPENKPIKVDLKRSDTRLTLSVKDEGPGVSANDLPHVFDGFYKGMDNQKEGMGIGLHLCKLIIKNLHGEIYLISKLKKGTKVEVSLPVLSHD